MFLFISFLVFNNEIKYNINILTENESMKQVNVLER